MKNIIFTWIFMFAVSFVASPEARGRGVFVKKGSNGIGVQGILSKSKNAIGLGTALGVSIKGILDLGLLIEHIELQDKTLDSEFTALGMGPSITFHIHKTDLVSMAVSASYELASFSGDTRVLNIRSIKSNVVAAGVSFYHSRPKSKGVSVIPILGLSFISTELVREYGFGGLNKNFNETFLGSFSLNIRIRHKTHNTIFVSSGAFVNESTFGLVLSVGYVFLSG